MALKDIIGQERAIEILRGCIKRNRVAHAYIFAGDEGIGKKLTAINFAKALNCQKPVTSKNKDLSLVTRHSSLIEIDCCDGCSSCIKINKSIHPDFFFIAPENGEIKVDVIRELQESISYKAFEGGWKVIIIDEAETLNQPAANACLKTLEEPPEQTILILISSMSG
ncbi:MAG: hypothetical protein U0937_02595, partial [Thermodesulfovibrionia bacterium]|nr:hypothetical protein [Thermodesulfovibrionia bacterium]